MLRNLMIILVGPSGSGKSTLLERVLANFDDFCDIVTFTSRKMRKGEQEGIPYHFVDREKFESLIKDEFFVEWAEVHGNLYGTPREHIEKAWANGFSIIMDLDVQGARAMLAEYPDVVTIFIHPPSIDELRHRIIKREGYPPSDLDLRMANAQKEMAAADEFGHQIINNDLEASFRYLKNLIEECKNSG